MDGFWIFLTAVCLGGIVGLLQLIKLTFQHKLAMAERQNAPNQDYEARFAKFEQRIANIETIVLEREHQRSFDEALKQD